MDDSDGEQALASEAVGGEPLQLPDGAHGNSRQVSYNDSGLTVVTIETQDESAEDGMLYLFTTHYWMGEGNVFNRVCLSMGVTIWPHMNLF